MKNLKKLISVIIAVIMIVGSFATVSAADYKDVESTNSYAKAIQVLSGLGIVKGDDQGNFNPTNDIKRSEMVALICRAMGEEDVANGAVTDAFDDVAPGHWAAGNIAWGVNRGIINGIGDRQFAPDASVSYQDAVVMIMRALGYDRIAQRKENGGYPDGYLKLASQHGVLDNAGYAQKTAATREIVAQLIFNSLTAGMVDVTEYGDSVEDDKYKILDGKGDKDLKNLLTDINDIYRVKATVESTAQSNPDNIDKNGEHKVVLALDDACDFYTIGKVAAKIGAGLVDHDEDPETAKIYKGTYYVGETDISNYLGYTVEAYITKGDRASEYVILAAVVDEKSVVTEDITKNFATIKYDDTNDVVKYRANLDDRKETKIEFNKDAATYYYNGSDVENLAALIDGVDDLIDDVDIVDLEDVLQNADKITFLGDRNGYNKLFITNYTYDRVKSVDAETKIIETVDGDVYDFGNREEKFILGLFDAEGNEIAIEDIKEDDVLNVLCPLGVEEWDADFLNIYVTNETVTGKVSEKTEDSGVYTYKIDGVEYYVAGDLELSNGAEGVFYITIDGKIMDKDVSTVISKNFAFLMGVIAEKDYKDFAYELVLFTGEGKKERVPVADAVKVYVGASETPTRYVAGLTTETATTKPLAKAFAVAGTYGETVVASNGIFTDYAADAGEADAVANFANRFFTYKTDSDGALTEIRIASDDEGAEIVQYGKIADYDDDDTFEERVSDIDWDADYNEFSGEAISDATKLFVAPLTGTAGEENWNVDEDDLAIASFDSLDDTKDYAAFAYMLKGEKTLSAVLLAEEAGFALEKSPLAVLQSMGETLDENENDVDSYTFVQSGKVITLKGNYKEVLPDLTAGDVFQYVTNEANEIVDIEIVYNAEDHVLTSYAYELNAATGNKVGFVFGIITEKKDGAITITNEVGTKADTTDSIEAIGSTQRFKYADVEGATYALFEEALGGRGVRTSTIGAVKKSSRVSEAYAIVAKVNGKSNNKIEDVITIALNVGEDVIGDDAAEIINEYAFDITPDGVDDNAPVEE